MHREVVPRLADGPAAQDADVQNLRAIIGDRRALDRHAGALLQLAAIGSDSSVRVVLEAFAQRDILVDARDAGRALIRHPSMAAIAGLRELAQRSPSAVRLGALDVLISMTSSDPDLALAAREVIEALGPSILMEARAGEAPLRAASERIATLARERGLLRDI